MSIEIRYEVLSPEAEGRTVGPGEMRGGPPGIAFPPGARGPMITGGPMGPRPGGGPSPMRMATPASGPMAKRLDTFKNKTVYLVDTGFGGSYESMQQLQKWFATHMPSVTTIRKRKIGHVFMDDTTDLWDEIKAKGHAVVLGVAG